MDMDEQISFMDESIFIECQPWMDKSHSWIKMTDDKHGRSKNVFKATNLSNLQRNLWVEQCPHRHTTRICSVYSILGLA